jgi:hypothetical protein
MIFPIKKFTPGFFYKLLGLQQNLPYKNTQKFIGCFFIYGRIINRNHIYEIPKKKLAFYVKRIPRAAQPPRVLCSEVVGRWGVTPSN